MRVHILVLNYDGRQLLGECLPSVVEAALRSRYRCDVTVIDNNSHDDSLTWLAAHFPEVHVVRCENRGLSSFNEVVAGLESRVAVLLNNDIKLDAGAIDPLVDPLFDSGCFMTAPLCWLFDGQTYEGFKTAVRWRWGLVQATALFDGHASGIHHAGPTASAGAAMAVDCRKFVALGGFDPVYLPGRIEDLDFSLRGYLAGYHARYVPEAVAYHRGMATFGRVFGTAGCDQLALRNTLIFQWKNLRDPASLLRQVVGLPIRLAWDLIRLPLVARERRLSLARALFGAIGRLGQIRPMSNRGREERRRERFFFRRFHPRRMTVDQIARNEELWARRHPISRWYLYSVAGRLAHVLAPTRVRPVHLTACGLLAGLAAAAILYARPAMAPISGVLVLAWWFLDRVDGQLARLQGTVSTWGAWLDANADELVDVTIHVAMASAAAASATAFGQTAPPVAWGLLVAFLLGKYLLMHGLWTQEQPTDGAGTRGQSGRIGRLRALYHLPGNADVRAHLLAAALLTGWLTAELAVVAVYYNVRWMARYVLVARREGRSR